MGRRMVGAWCFVDHYGPDEIAARARHAGAAAPAHRAADRQLAARRRGAPPRQPRQRRADPARRARADDGGRGHRALRAVAGPALARCCTAPSCGWPCPTPSARTAPRVRSPRRPARAHRAGARRRRCCSASWPGPRSPGQVHTPLVGVDVALDGGRRRLLPLEPDFEHAVLTVSGAPRSTAGSSRPGRCATSGRAARAALRAGAPGRLLLLGGVPFAEKIVMWWNFVARTGEEIGRGPRALAGGAGGRASRPGYRQRSPAGPVRRVPGLRGPAARGAAAAVDAAALPRPYPLSCQVDQPAAEQGGDPQVG